MDKTERTATIGGVATGIALIVLTVAFAWWAATIPTNPALIDGLPPCATEDSDNCYWDAASMGNGEGLSFAVIEGEVIPWCTDAIIASEAECWGPLR
jgi:hypothetical protein